VRFSSALSRIAPAPAACSAALIGATLAATNTIRKRRDAPVPAHSLLFAAAAVGLAAASLAFAPAAAKDTGLVFVSNEKSNNVIVLDPKTYKVVKDLKVSRRPRDMHFSADRTKLYVACGDDDVIDIVDVARLEVIGRIPTGPSPETFAIDEQRRR